MTDSAETLLRSVMMSSLMPSAKYSCSASPLILAKGRTQTDSLSGAAAPWCATGTTAHTEKACTARSCAFTACSPRSSKAHAILPSILSRTIRDSATPPAGAKVWTRAATLTPSP